MKFVLSVLNKLSSADVKSEFLKIPSHDYVVEFIGDYNFGQFGICPVTTSLHFLPEHVSEVILSGGYYYSIDSVNDNFSSRSYSSIITKSLGHQFFLLVEALPRSIITLKVKLKSDSRVELDDPVRSEVGTNLMSCFSKLPANIEVLDLSQMQDVGIDEYAQLGKIYKAIPRTVKKLYPHQIDWINILDTQRDSFFKFGASGMLIVCLEHQTIMCSSKSAYKYFFSQLSPDVMGFSLAHCRVGNKAIEYAIQLIKSLGQHIVGLNLRDNDLYIFERHLPEFFQALPPNLAYLDISENNLLTLPSEHFKRVISFLPKKINLLKIHEKNIDPHPIDRIADNFASLPPNILCIGFSGNHWLGLKINQFMWALHRLSSKVFCIDYSDCLLDKMSIHDFYTLITYTPSHVTKLILKRNNLAALSAQHLSHIFSRIPYQLLEIDISENGFDRLPLSKLNELVDALPDIFINFGPDKIMRRFDGQLVPFPWREDNIYFQRVGLIYHQTNLAEYFLLINQMMKQKNLSESVVLKILNYLIPAHPPRMTRNLIRKSSLFIHPKQQVELLDYSKKMTARLEMQKSRRTLNLSYSGLKINENISSYKLMYSNVPHTVERINFRCNGLALYQGTLSVFAEGLRYIPKNVTYIDLSGNYFEHLPPMMLRGLMLNIPSSVKYVSVSTERPVSVSDHLSRLEDVPAYFHRLIANEDNILAKLVLLLRDYSQDDSWFKRLIFGYWNRQNIPEVRRLMYIINSNQLRDFADIMQYMQNLNMPNDSGALAKSMSLIFREHQGMAPKPQGLLTSSAKL